MSHYSKLSILAITLTAAGTVAYAAKDVQNDALAIRRKNFFDAGRR